MIRGSDQKHALVSVLPFNNIPQRNNRCFPCKSALLLLIGINNIRHIQMLRAKIPVQPFGPVPIAEKNDLLTVCSQLSVQLLFLAAIVNIVGVLRYAPDYIFNVFPLTALGIFPSVFK